MTISIRFLCSILVCLVLPVLSFGDTSATYVDPNNFNPVALCTGPNADATCTFANLFHNVGITVNQGMRILYSISAVLGVAAVITGLMKMRHHSSDMQGTSGSMRTGLYAITVGGLLIAIPAVTLLSANSLFGNQNIKLVTEAQALNVSGELPTPQARSVATRYVKPAVNSQPKQQEAQNESVH